MGASLLAIESRHKKQNSWEALLDYGHAPRSGTLRRGRVSLPGHTYLLTTTTLRREPILKDLLAGRRVVREMMSADVHTLSYVVMPDHFHWLIELYDVPLNRIMQTLKSRSAIAINKFLGRRGPVWQDGYHDHAVRKDENLCTIARYIANNPLRAGLVDDVRFYSLWDAIWL